jgi:hypothetical protein
MTLSIAKTREKACSSCGASFPCGPGSGADGAGCWCADLPPLTSPMASADCLCAHCLREAIALQQASGV